MHFESGVGHIGGNLFRSSPTDLFVSSHFYARRYVVLSKGHVAGPWYTSLCKEVLSQQTRGRDSRQKGGRIALPFVLLVNAHCMHTRDKNRKTD
jgi:hypothetical protein